MLEEITETQEINFTLRYVEDPSQTPIEDGRVLNNITATGLDSVYMKSGGESISETLISEPSPFPSTQNLLDSIHEIPKSNSAYVRYFFIESSVF